MLCNNFQEHYFHFSSYHRKPNVPSSSQVRTTNVNKQRLLSTPRRFFPVSAGGSEVITASLGRQFNDSADFADFSAANLDISTLVAVDLVA